MIILFIDIKQIYKDDYILYVKYNNFCLRQALIFSPQEPTQGKIINQYGNPKYFHAKEDLLHFILLCSNFK